MDGFSEALVFVGAFGAAEVRVLAMIGTLGILIGAAYMLWTLQRIFFGEFNSKWEDVLDDINPREYAMLIPLTIIIIFLGIYPSAMLDIMNSSVNTLVEFISNSAESIRISGNVKFNSKKRVIQA